MGVKRYDSIGNAPMQVSEHGHFVTFDDYQMAGQPAHAPAELRWESRYYEFAEGLASPHYFEAVTPFGSVYELHWCHPGELELTLSPDGYFTNLDIIETKYGLLDVETAPYWEACYIAADGLEPSVFPKAEFGKAKLLCENDYVIRVAQALGFTNERRPASERPYWDWRIESLPSPVG